MKTIIYPIFNQSIYDSAYSAIAGSSDGNVYFSLCTHMPQSSAGMFRFDPIKKTITFLYDVSSVIKNKKSVHGKIHTQLIENNDSKLYFATHFAYPYGLPQSISYEGGRLLSQDLMGNVEDLGVVQKGNGIINMVVDKVDNLIYLLTIPEGHLFRYDIKQHEYTDLGKVPSNGSICRSIAIDKVGNVYGSYDGSGVFIYNKSKGKLEFHNDKLLESDMDEWNSSSRGGVNRLSRSIWRCVDYDESRNKLFGILSTKSLAFSLDCDTKQFLPLYPMEVDDEPRPKASTIYPTLSMTSNHQSIFYASSTGLFDYCRSENIDGWSSLISLDKDASNKTNLGIIADAGRKTYGVSAAKMLNEYELVMIGAVEVKDGESYNSFNIINQKPFHLALIHIDIR